MSYTFGAASGKPSIEKAWHTCEVTGGDCVAILLRRKLSLGPLQRRS